MRRRNEKESKKERIEHSYKEVNKIVMLSFIQTWLLILTSSLKGTQVLQVV